MSRNRNRNPLGVAIIIALVIGVLAAGIVSSYFFYQEDSHSNCVVDSKDRTSKTDADGNTSSDARIYTENCGTFQVSDSLIKGQFNSADTFGSIKEGETYDFTTIGWRFGLTSSFPNIVDVVESE